MLFSFDTALQKSGGPLPPPVPPGFDATGQNLKSLCCLQPLFQTQDCSQQQFIGFSEFSRAPKFKCIRGLLGPGPVCTSVNAALDY